MLADHQELSRTYTALGDAEIAALYAQIDTLSDIAHTALEAEIARRQLSREELQELCSSQVGQEGDFDWRERAPLNTMTSLEAFYQTPQPRKPVYVPIEGNWYIWADW